MKNIFYIGYIQKIGGVETFLYQIAKIYKDYDITIYYKGGDKDQIRRLKKYVRTIQYNGEKIKCKKAFFNYDISIIDNVEAEEYYQIIHADYVVGKIKPHLHDKINKYFGVSKIVCDSFTKLTGIKCELLYNPIQIEKPKKLLKLIIASRFAADKGKLKERVLELIKELDKYNNPYDLQIFTNDELKINNPNVTVRETTLNILPYIAEADYLVLLSDTEGLSYNILEALSLGTKLIITNLPLLNEAGVKDGENAIVLNFDMSNLDIKKIYDLADKEFTYNPPKSEWEKMLEKGKSTYQDELKAIYTVEALEIYNKTKTYDNQLKKIPETGERWEVNKERLDVLLGDNPDNRIYVKVVDRKEKK